MPGFGDLRKIEAGNGVLNTPATVRKTQTETGQPELSLGSGAGEFVENIGFIIFFLVILLGISMTLGQKVLYAFLWLVLLGMVFTGWPKIEALIRRYV